MEERDIVFRNLSMTQGPNSVDEFRLAPACGVLPTPVTCGGEGRGCQGPFNRSTPLRRGPVRRAALGDRSAESATAKWPARPRGHRWRSKVTGDG